MGSFLRIYSGRGCCGLETDRALFGWIVPNDGTDDLFVDHRSIVGDDIRTLPIDAMVTYQSRINSKGLEAINVSLMK